MKITTTRKLCYNTNIITAIMNATVITIAPYEVVALRELNGTEDQKEKCNILCDSICKSAKHNYAISSI